MKRKLLISIFLIIAILSIVLASCKDREYFTLTYDYQYGEKVTTIRNYSGSSVELPNTPKREDFSFGGWFFDKDVWKEPYTADYFSKNPQTCDMTVYAKWIQDPTYTVTFVTNGGTSVDSIKLHKGEVLESEPTTTKTDCQFLGWYSDYTLTVRYEIGTAVKGNLVLYAKWLNPNNPSVYVVSFDENGGTKTENARIIEGGRVTSPDVSKAGYVLAGWYLDEVFTLPYDFSNMVTNDFTLYAKWEEAEVLIAVSFECNGGETLPLLRLPYGGQMTTQSPQKEGFTFEGWYRDEGLTQIFDGNNRLYADITLYAKWAPKPEETVYFTVSYQTNGGSVCPPERVPEGELLPYSSPLKEGFLFEGWFYDESFTEASDFASPVTKDLTLYAKWKEKTVTVEENYSFRKSEDGTYYSIVSYTGSSTIIDIPSTYRDLPIYAIEDEAFRQKEITRLTLSTSLKSIGAGAFYGCSALASVTIKANIQRVGANAFASCLSLTSLTVEGNVEFGEKAFSDCHSLGSVTATVGFDVSRSMFSSCRSLTTVVIGDECTLINASAFSGCGSLTEFIVPKECEAINPSAFSGCISLSSLSFSGSLLKLIGENAFSGTAISSLALPDSVEKLSERCFANSRVSEISIGKNTNTISESAFIGCSSLTEFSVSSENLYYAANEGSLYNKELTRLVFYKLGADETDYNTPSSVQSFASYAFCGAVNVQNVRLNEGLETAPTTAFSQATSIKAFYVSEDNDSYKAIDGHLYSYDGSVLVRYAPASAEKEYVVPEGVVSISFAFVYAENLEKVYLPSSLTRVSEYAFSYASQLKEVVLGEGTEEIATGAFTSCSSLENVTIPNTEKVVTIGDNVFSNSPFLTVPQALLSAYVEAYGDKFSYKN